MAERESGYTRIVGDDYATPSWVTNALLDVEKFEGKIWEPAPGDGHMVRALEARGYKVVTTRFNFLGFTHDGFGERAIVTNPPYALATQFCRLAISLMMPRHGKVAMLLPMSFDCAMGRRDLFADCEQFKCKLTLTRRIRWANIEQKAAGPSMNHAWFVWQWGWHGAPQIGYLPRD